MACGKLGEVDAHMVVRCIDCTEFSVGFVVYHGRVLYDSILFKKNEKIVLQQQG